MKKCFKHNDFLHYKHFTTAILLQLSISHIEILSKLNSTGFSNSPDHLYNHIIFKPRIFK